MILLVVKGEDFQPIDRRFESWRRILDGIQVKLTITLKKRKPNGAYQKVFKKSSFETSTSKSDTSNQNW